MLDVLEYEENYQDIVSRECFNVAIPHKGQRCCQTRTIPREADGWKCECKENGDFLSESFSMTQASSPNFSEATTATVCVGSTMKRKTYLASFPGRILGHITEAIEKPTKHLNVSGAWLRGKRSRSQLRDEVALDG